MDDQQELEPWLVLQKIPAIGLAGLHRLLSRFGSPSRILLDGSGLEECLSPVQRESIRPFWKAGRSHPAWGEAQSELEQLTRQGIHLLSINSPLYPWLLRETCHHPLVLYVRGDPSLLSSRQLAVVGGREAGKEALSITSQWAAGLARSGLTITSGLALGVDGAAHAGTLQAGGKTIAIVAHGLDQLYPPAHRRLMEQIAETGAVVSEFALGELPRREHFPRRNRVISGLSHGVLVVEAAIKSGSLITARYALEQNREVFALPGVITNPMVKGCHALIKEGAYLVESPEEILSILGWQQGPQQLSLVEDALSVDTVSLPDTVAKLLQAIPFRWTHPDEIVQGAGLGIAELTRELLLLELDGYVESQAGNFRRTR